MTTGKSELFRDLRIPCTKSSSAWSFVLNSASLLL